MLSSKNEAYFSEYMQMLIQKIYNSKKEIHQKRTIQIVNCLCSSIKPERVFIEFSKIFEKMKDLAFIQDIIETLTFSIASMPIYRQFR